MAFLLCGLPGCTKKSKGASPSKGNTYPGNGAVSGGSRRGATYAGTPGVRNAPVLHPLSQPGSEFHVEYSPDTTVVDMAMVGRSLRGVSQDHSIFLFEDSPELRARLIPGKHVLFQGLDLRKVDALALYKNQLVVGTEKANLRQALKNIQIQTKTPVNFSDVFQQLAASPPGMPGPQVASYSPLLRFWDALQPTVYAGIRPHDMEGEFEVADTDFAIWKVHFHFYVPDENMHVDVQLKREANGLNVDLDAKGTIHNFIQQLNMQMSNGGPLRMDFRALNFDADIDFDWTIKTSENKTPMNEVRFKLPKPARISIPLIEFTDLPMSLDISEALLFHPAFTTKEEVARGSFHVKYSGDEGFKLDGQQIQTEGQGEGDGAIDQSFAFSPFASFGLVVAMAVPRVELRMGTDELWDMAKIPLPANLTETLSDVLLNNTIAGQWLKKKMGNPLEIEGAAYLQLVISTTAAHSGMQSLVPCQQFTMVATGQAGVDATWLGNNTNLPAKELFTKNITQRQPDSKICGGG
jgi:hypothetical protein